MPQPPIGNENTERGDNKVRDWIMISFLRDGRCLTCGIQTHNIDEVTSRRSPINDEFILEGRCLLCQPLPDNFRSNPFFSAAEAQMPQAHIVPKIPIAKDSSFTRH